MKIAIYHNHYSKSSGEDVMFRLQCDALEALGHQVLPVTAEVNDVLKKQSKFALAKMGIQSAHNPTSVKRVQQVIRDFQPDIAHVHNWFPIFSPAIYQAHFEHQIPVVQTLHNYRLGCATGNFRFGGSDCEECLTRGRHRAVTKKCYQNSSAGSYFWKRAIDKNFNNGSFLHSMLHYVCPSEEVLQRHLSIGLPQEKMTVIPNACRDPLEGSNTHPKSSPIKIVYLGRLVSEKGVGTLIDAWKQLMADSAHKDTMQSAELILIGEGNDQSQFENQAAQLPNIKFTGYLSHSDALHQLKTASLVVFPSQWAEPFGLGVIEGMAAGAAVIASDIGGPGELVNEGANGWLFKAGNTNDLAAKLKEALTEPKRLETIGSNGRHTYLLKYQPRTHAEQLIHLYEGLINEADQKGIR